MKNWALMESSIFPSFKLDPSFLISHRRDFSFKTLVFGNCVFICEVIRSLVVFPTTLGAQGGRELYLFYPLLGDQNL